MVEAMSKSIGQTEVLVAGGGPAGLATAIAVRQAGFEVAVVDCAQPPIDKACGEGIMPDGLAALRQLGVQIGPGQAAPFRGIRFLSDDDHVEAEFPHGVGYGIRRTALHRLLIDRATEVGASLYWGARITGVSAKGVAIGEQHVGYRWLVCADGHNSLLRRSAGLEVTRSAQKRFGFRRHYRVTPWSDFVEVHWSDCGQMYVTPVSDDEICVAFITRRPGLRLEEALPDFSRLWVHLRAVAPDNRRLGALSVTQRLAAVQRGNIALVGEASGSVDAVTGEGLSMAFRQAIALAEAMREENLQQYEMAHQCIARLPRMMSALMLAMDKHPSFRRRVFRALTSEPDYFRRLLALHTGAISPWSIGLRETVSLGWHLLAA
jgi:flavin-dependent dehydrogenase